MNVTTQQSEPSVIETMLKAEALLDVICAAGLTIKKGQTVRVTLMFHKSWPAGGFRTVINGGIDFTNADAYYDCFKKVSNG